MLVGMGWLLRRLLRMGSRAATHQAGLPPLHPQLQSVYSPMAREVETSATILGITLNDAFEERSACHHDMAWRMVGLSAREWDHLAEIVKALLNTLGKHAANATVVVPARRLARERFKSRVMIDFLRMPELLDLVVLRSRLRFQLQIRFLRRAAGVLTEAFRNTYRYMERTGDQSPEFWTRLDVYSYDFDLIAKETLLAFRALLSCLSPQDLPNLSGELTNLLHQGVSKRPVPANR
jgi:hypothetical protein